MINIQKRRAALFLSMLALFVIICIGAYIWFFEYNRTPDSKPPDKSPVPTTIQPAVGQPSNPVVMYQGIDTNIADVFSVKVPNGWTASVSTAPSFIAIMFSRPNSLESLVYNADTPPVINRSGIASWGGLSEHFFVLSPTTNSKFNPAEHQEVSSEAFVFDDGHAGQKFYVVKRAAEAKKWGGLQKDSEWQGRTYIYESTGTRIEAHVALYPSSERDVDFFEKVIRSIKPISR